MKNSFEYSSFYFQNNISLTVLEFFFFIFNVIISFLNIFFRLTLVLSCAMKFESYPHDTQICSMMIESRMLNKKIKQKMNSVFK